MEHVRGLATAEDTWAAAPQVTGIDLAVVLSEAANYRIPWQPPEITGVHPLPEGILYVVENTTRISSAARTRTIRTLTETVRWEIIGWEQEAARAAEMLVEEAVIHYRQWRNEALNSRHVHLIGPDISTAVTDATFTATWAHH